MKKQKKSSLLAKYSLLYQKKPKSRVFAPLAESYRKLGMLEEAFKILKEGIKRHPTYVMGYIVLAHCYFDQENYELAYNTIRPFVSDHLENISLQKLFAQICINLGYLEEALNTFKYLLLINPKDQYVSEQVKLLEDDLLLSDEQKKEEPDSSGSFSDDDDEWVQVDFNQTSVKRLDDEPAQNWEMEPPEKGRLSAFKNEIQKESLEVDEHPLDDAYYYEEYDNEEFEKDPEEESSQKIDPIITHTLVDLYCRQGHVDKAIEILESILELHPNDQASLRKLREVKEQKAGENFSERPVSVLKEAPETENDGHEQLADLVEEKVKNNKERSLKLLENKLTIFLQKIKKESKAKLEHA